MPDGSAHWHRRYRLGGFQVGWHVYRHTYATSSDRWVVQPFVIYDRRDRA